MVPHKRKTFYGVVRGRRAPIVSSWGVAGALVDGYGNSLHRGFETFDEAKEWMATNGCPEFRCYMPDDDGIAPAARFKGGYYAVARGRRPGIYLTWRETKDHVDGFEHSLYKKFRSEQEAQLYIDENKVTREVIGCGVDPEDTLPSIDEGVPRLTLKHSSSSSSDLSDG